MSSTPTPVDDNRLNRNDESMYSAIDKMMSNSEQSYDDFMKSFTHLQTEDLGTILMLIILLRCCSNNTPCFIQIQMVYRLANLSVFH